MNLNQLEYFISVAENLSFTKAANQCFISQTAMTQQIKTLEKKVGVSLFVRDKHHVELTTAGRIYLKEAKAIIEKSEEAIRLVRSAATGLEGELKVGFLSGFGYSDANDILKKFCRKYPNVKLSFTRDTMSGLMDSISRGGCDAAFMLPPGKGIIEQISHEYYKSYPLMAVLNSEHELAGKESLTYSDLCNEKFIIMQPSGRSRDEMEEMILIYNRGSFIPEIVALEREPETILLMISLGQGISLMPEYIIRFQKNNPDLKIIPMVKQDGSAETLDMDIAWSKQNTNPAVDKLRELLTINT